MAEFKEVSAATSEKSFCEAASQRLHDEVFGLLPRAISEQKLQRILQSRKISRKWTSLQ